MHDLLALFGFTLLLIRFAYWVGSSLEKPNLYILPTFLAEIGEGLLLFFVFVQMFGETLLPMPQNIAVQLIGLACTAGGTCVAFLAKKQMGDEWVYASAYTLSPKKKLVTQGMFAKIRHPIYAGILVSYVGAMLLAGSWLWVSLLFLFIPFYFQAQKEEKLLLRKFGKKYKLYVVQTKMFVPGIF